MKRMFFVLGLSIASLTVGCSQTMPAPKPTVGVAGKVVFANGDPVRLAFVTFEPKDPLKGVTATSWTDKNGKFNLRSYSVNEPDGAVKGEYIVHIEPYDPGFGFPIPKGVTPSPIPERFQKSSTANITVEIEDEMDGLELKLK